MKKYTKINLSIDDIDAILREDPALLIDAMLSTQTKLIRDVRKLQRKERTRTIISFFGLSFLMYSVYDINKSKKKVKTDGEKEIHVKNHH